MVQQPEWAKASSWSRIHDHTDTPQSVGLLWTCDQPDAETSTWQHTTLTRQTSMLPVVFEPTISVGERPQTYALDGAATGTGLLHSSHYTMLHVWLLYGTWTYHTPRRVMLRTTQRAFFGSPVCMSSLAHRSIATLTAGSRLLPAAYILILWRALLCINRCGAH